MSDFPNVINFNPTVISSASYESVGVNILTANISFSSSATWPLANLALFVPVFITTPIIIAKMFWQNGSTVGNNSIDVGIYNSEGTKLVSSGSNATSGATAIQSVDITDTLLQRGLYYMAMALNGTTDIIGTTPAGGFPTPLPRACGSYEQTSSFPLPTSVTYVGSTRSFLPFIAITQSTIV